jgi:hypothetical protein
MATGLRVVVALLAGLAASGARAASIRWCDRPVAACRAAECATLQGRDRHRCLNACKCGLYGEFRWGSYGSLALLFHGSLVLPDGSGVVFQLTNDHSILPWLVPDPPEEGWFFVRADGTGLRRLRPRRLVDLEQFAPDHVRLDRHDAPARFRSRPGRPAAPPRPPGSR